MNYNFLLFKPSKYFYIFCIVVFPIWFLLGPISWRHIDDYGPMYTFIQKYISDSEFVFPADYSNINPLKIFVSSLTDNYGWGSYPQLWSIIYLPLSLSFIKYGLDITRYITISIGFLTCTLISFLLSNIITILIANKNKIKNKYFEKLRLNSDFFACLI